MSGMMKRRAECCQHSFTSVVGESDERTGALIHEGTRDTDTDGSGSIRDPCADALGRGHTRTRTLSTVDSVPQRAEAPGQGGSDRDPDHLPVLDVRTLRAFTHLADLFERLRAAADGQREGSDRPMHLTTESEDSA